MSYWAANVIGVSANPNEELPQICDGQGFDEQGMLKGGILTPAETSMAEESNHSPSNRMSTQHYISQAKADWTPTRDSFLVEQMIEQQNLGKRSDMGWTKDAWRTVLVAFNTKFGLKFYLQQLKSRLALLRKQYWTVKELLEQPGFNWDKIYQTVVADDEVWESHIMANPKAKQFRRANFPLHDQLALLFDSTQQPLSRYETGDTRVRRQPKNSDHLSSFNSSNLLGLTKNNEDGESSFEEDISMEEYDNNKCKTNPKLTNRKRKRISPGNRIAAALESLVAASESYAQIPILSEKFQYDKCLEELQQLGGLDDQELTQAVELLKDEKNAIAFMTLRGQLRISWLRMKCHRDKQ